MDIKEISKDVLFKKYKVVVPKKDITAAVENKAQELAKTAQIPGFRVGKVPLNMVKSRYKNEIKSDLINHFIDSGVNKIVKENQFDLAERPSVNSVDFKEEGPFVFEVDFELLPKMPKIDFSKIKLTEPTAQVSEKDVNDSLVKLQKRNMILNSVQKDIPVEAGYVVLIDATGYIDGKEFPEGKVKDHKLKIGSKQFIPGFEDGLIGSRTGEEKTLKLKFPKDYHSKEFAGKEVTFVVKVKEVFKEELPKLDDEFAKKFNLKNLSELHKAIKKSEQERLNSFSKTILKKELFDKLDKEIKIDLPKKLLQRELEFVNKSTRQDEVSQQQQKTISSKAKKTTSKGKTKSGKSDNEIKYEKIAERRIKLGLFVNDISKKEKITLSQQDISDEVMLQLRANPESASFLMKHYKENPEALEPLRGKVLEDKAVAFMLSKVVTQKKNVTAEELNALYNKTS